MDLSWLNVGTIGQIAGLLDKVGLGGTAMKGAVAGLSIASQLGGKDPEIGTETQTPDAETTAFNTDFDLGFDYSKAVDGDLAKNWSSGTGFIELPEVGNLGFGFNPIPSYTGDIGLGAINDPYHLNKIWGGKQ